MADPKYSNLPYIAKDEPDLYETTELPEADQPGIAKTHKEVPDEHVIERLAVDPKEAYERFKSTVLSSDRVNFSDTSVPSARSGYDARTEYEVLGAEDRAKEDPLHRYQRIKCEVKDLLDTLSQSEGGTIPAGGDKSKQAVVSKMDVVQELDRLHTQLSKLPLVATLGVAEASRVEATDSAQFRSLVSEIQKCGSASAQSPKKGGEGSPKGAGITYELYCQPQALQDGKQSKSAELERRLHRLESALGVSDQGASQLAALSGETNLASAVNTLSSRLSLVNGEEVERMDRRLQALNDRLDQALDKRQQLQQQQQQLESAKVKELYECVKKWDSVVDVLPTVTNRLVALEQLHQQVMQFTATLKHLDTAQSEIKQSLGSQQGALTQVSKTFSDNMATLQKNCATIDKRLKAIGK